MLLFIIVSVRIPERKQAAYSNYANQERLRKNTVDRARPSGTQYAACFLPSFAWAKVSPGSGPLLVTGHAEI